MERQIGRPGAGLETPHSAGDAGAGPSSLGPYRVLSSLGEGRTGEVYLAENERTSRRVAVKRLRPEGLQGAGERALVLREARAVARLSHPSIVQVLDVLEDEAGDCIVMELAEGRSLAAMMERGEIDVPLALRLGRELAEGLAEAHAKGVVHRDLKASNVLLAEDGHLRILGFGLPAAPWSEDTLSLGGEEDSTIELTAENLERVRTLSPEQIAGHPVDSRTDLYALGVLLYEMLTGSPPFVGEDLVDVLLHIQSGPPPPVYKECPEAPLQADGLLQRLLAKNPSRRPQSARQVAGELERLAAEACGRSGETASETPPPRPREEGPETRTLVRAELVGTERWERMLGAERAAELFGRHDREASELAKQYRGHVAREASGLLLLFERSVDAVGFAVAYQQALARLSVDEPVHLSARLGVHQGRLEEGKAVRALVERLKEIAAAGQTILTRAVFDEARGIALAGKLADPHLRWVAHGTYAIPGAEEGVALYEVGVKGLAPLKRPPESNGARPVKASGAEQTLGWRPAVGQAIPRCPSWELVERLDAEELGESWLAAQASGETRVFSFSFAAARRRSFPFGVPRASAAELRAEEMKSEATVG